MAFTTTSAEIKKAREEQNMKFFTVLAEEIGKETHPDPWWIVAPDKTERGWTEGEMNLLERDAKELGMIKSIGLSFSLVDVNGDSLVDGSITDLVEWLRKDNATAKFLHTSLVEDDSWKDRDDVAALHMLLNGEEELCFLSPELTRQFLCQVVLPHK